MAEVFITRSNSPVSAHAYCGVDGLQFLEYIFCRPAWNVDILTVLRDDRQLSRLFLAQSTATSIDGRTSSTPSTRSRRCSNRGARCRWATPVLEERPAVDPVLAPRPAPVLAADPAPAVETVEEVILLAILLVLSRVYVLLSCVYRLSVALVPTFISGSFIFSFSVL